MKSPIPTLLAFAILASHAALGSQIPMRHAVTPDLPSQLSDDLRLGQFDLPVPRVPESLDFDGFHRSYLNFYSVPHDLMASDFVKTSGRWSRITAIVTDLDTFDPPTIPARGH